MRLLIYEQLKPEKGIDYTRTHLRRKTKDGSFPKPIPVSDKRIAWIEEEVDAWLEERKKQRDVGRPASSSPAEAAAVERERLERMLGGGDKPRPVDRRGHAVSVTDKCAETGRCPQ